MSNESLIGRQEAFEKWYLSYFGHKPPVALNCKEHEGMTYGNALAERTWLGWQGATYTMEGAGNYTASNQDTVEKVPEATPSANDTLIGSALHLDWSHCCDEKPSVIINGVHFYPVAWPNEAVADALMAVKKAVEKVPSCTCHPDDSPPVPCPGKYAFTNCVNASAPVSSEIRDKADCHDDFITYMMERKLTPTTDEWLAWQKAWGLAYVQGRNHAKLDYEKLLKREAGNVINRTVYVCTIDDGIEEVFFLKSEADKWLSKQKVSVGVHHEIHICKIKDIEVQEAPDA